MKNELTHRVVIEVYADYPSGEKLQSIVTVCGDGGLDHMLDSFRASLVASSFSAGIASQLVIADE